MTHDTTRHDGGPAFPAHPSALGDHDGMSLRDYFAAKVMPECMRAAADHTKAGSGMSEVIARAAIFSYAYADAMLKARKA